MEEQLLFTDKQFTQGTFAYAEHDNARYEIIYSRFLDGAEMDTPYYIILHDTETNDFTNSEYVERFNC